MANARIEKGECHRTSIGNGHGREDSAKTHTKLCKDGTTEELVLYGVMLVTSSVTFKVKSQPLVFGIQTRNHPSVAPCMYVHPKYTVHYVGIYTCIVLEPAHSVSFLI